MKVSKFGTLGTCVYVFFFSLPLSLFFLLDVLFLSSVQSGWPLWIEGRSDSVEKVDWWLIVQPDLARPNWLGCDPVLARCPLIFSLSLFSALFFFYPCLPLWLWHTQRHTQCINIHVCSDSKHTSSLCFFSPSLIFFAALNSSLLPSFILRCFLSSFLCPLCFLCHCSFRTGFVPWVSSSGFILQPPFILSETWEKHSKKNYPNRQICWI